MKQTSTSEQGTPPPLRILHGLIFTAFTALAVLTSHPEVEHLVRSQFHPFNVGPPPRMVALLASLAAVVGLSVVLVQAVRGRSARLHWSALILGAVALASWGNREGPATGRTEAAANLRILQTARALHGRMVNELQTHGAVPEDEDTWRAALEEVSQGHLPLVRTHSFEPLPFRLVVVKESEALPSEVPPGTLLLRILGGGAAYELHMVGVSATGEPWRLEAEGEPLVLRAAFNPDLPPLPKQAGPGAH